MRAVLLIRRWWRRRNRDKLIDERRPPVRKLASCIGPLLLYGVILGSLFAFCIILKGVLFKQHGTSLRTDTSKEPYAISNSPSFYHSIKDVNAVNDKSLYLPEEVPQLLREGGGFNMKVSDRLPLNRTVADFRDSYCKNQKYDLNSLPKATVIIYFYNEHFSTLMRTIFSVLQRSPPELLGEILLVDDGSTADHIRENGSEKVVKYIRRIEKVRMIRNPVRTGIVGARMAGIRAAVGPVLIVLDSHVEVQEGWLEPLCDRLKTNPKSILLPVLDHIDPVTFKEGKGGIGCYLGFLWKLIEHGDDDWRNESHDISPQLYKIENGIEPSPQMAGGVFAVLKDFFFENGAYDDGFECWGTENLEISFRTWMCGGSVECVPCSRVFHLFRSGGFAYKCDPNAVLRNKVRTLMWMDEYAELAWNVLGRPNIDYHDDTLELRRQWRKDHNCKSFQWYMDTVFPGGDVRNLDDVPYLGKIVNVASSNCLFYSNNSPGASIHILPCEEDQHFEFIYFKRRLRIIPLTNDEACLVNEGKFVWCARSIECEWMYDGKLLMNKGLCLSGEGNKFLMVKCNEEDMNQVWNWQRYVPAENFIVPLLTDST